jgi:hypothetical protein
MAQMTAAIFDHREDAHRAVHALRDHGVDEDSISLLAVADDGSGKTSDLDHGERVPAPGTDEGISTTTPGDAAKGAAEGAAIGAGVGLLAALSSIFVPGFGLITAGGALATALWGAVGATVGGTVAGGVTGFLADMGVPDETAREYHDALKRGGVLVSVHDTDEATADEIQVIFHKYNGRSAGSYAGTVPAASATPQSLDATNARLQAGATDERINPSGDLSRSEFSPSAGNVAATTRDAATANPHLDAVEGDEGSATGRLGDVRLGAPPNDFGASTDELEGTTNAVIDTGNVGSTTSGLGEMDSGVTVRTEPPDTPSANVTGTLGGNVGGVGGTTGGLTGGLGGSVGDQPGIAGGTAVGFSGALGGTTGILADTDVDGGPRNTTEDMTGRSGGGELHHRPTAAEIAGTAGGASAGANDKSIGDYDSAVRPDERRDLSDVSDPGPTGNTVSATDGSTAGGFTDTGGRAGISTSGGADTSVTLDSGATATRLEDDDTV